MIPEPRKIEKMHSCKLVSSVTKNIVFVIITKLVVRNVTELNNHLPGVHIGSRYVAKDICVKKIKIKNRDKIMKKKNGKFFEDCFGVVIVSFF